MDSITIESIKLKTRIGVHAWEKKLAQTLLIDLALFFDFAEIEDNVEQTIDYDKLTQHIEQYVTGQSFELIESVANQVAAEIFKQFPVSKLTISVTKPHALRLAKSVKVSSTRFRVCR